MKEITITLPDQKLLKLKEMAEHFGITPEALVRLSVEDLLTRPDQAFEAATSRVLDKNADLYSRLA
jgi:hypothetical protein